MITKTLKTGLFIIAVASFSFASAQEKLEVKKDKSEKVFQYIDDNADGIITIQEYIAKRLKDPSKESEIKKRFLSIDTDQNKTLDRAEFRAYYENRGKSKKIENKVKAQKKKSIELEKKG